MIPPFPDFPLTVAYARSLRVTGRYVGVEPNTKGQPSIVIDEDNARWPTRFTIALDQVKAIEPGPIETVTPVPTKKRRSKGRRK